ncbi:MAG: FAD-dependent 5-carboxymethylaminomethyl-2-thiouridine(34) oxidoreductase MnmC, partial [Rhodospirillaceae bacterium]
GAVRRELSARGFATTKRPGFGAKRNRLHGEMVVDPPPSSTEPWCGRPPPLLAGASVAVIGAGIAGAATARALFDAGANVTLIDRRPATAGGASGTPAGILQPRPLPFDAAGGGLFSAAYGHAAHFYDGIDAAWLTKGVLVLGRDAADRARYEHLPGGTAVDPDAASERAGLRLAEPGVWFGDGGLLDTQRVCAALSAGIERWIADIAALTQADGSWQLRTADSVAMFADAVVLAGGIETGALGGYPHLGMVANRGQVTFHAASDATARLRTVLTFGGYLTPADAAGHVLGATFDRLTDARDDAWQAPRDADDARNREALVERLPGLADALGPARGAWTGIRATTPDRLPLVGPVPDAPTPDAPLSWRPGLYTLSGLGSRGFLTAPLAGEILAALMFGGPLPAPADAPQLMHPSRFRIRALRKGRA